MAETVLFKGGDFVKAAFTKMLRTAFRTQTLLPQYAYTDSALTSKISIFESFPKQVFHTPSLVVSIGQADMSQSSISDFDYLRTDSVVNPDLSKTSFSYGTWTGTAKITVLGITDTDRRLMRDMAMLFCRHLFRVYASQLGISYNKVVSVGESEIDWQGQRLYSDEIHISCYTEFQVSYSDELVSALNLVVNSTLGS